MNKISWHVNGIWNSIPWDFSSAKRDLSRAIIFTLNRKNIFLYRLLHSWPLNLILSFLIKTIIFYAFMKPKLHFIVWSIFCFSLLETSLPISPLFLPPPHLRITINQTVFTGLHSLEEEIELKAPFKLHCLKKKKKQFHNQ